MRNVARLILCLTILLVIPSILSAEEGRTLPKGEFTGQLEIEESLEGDGSRKFILNPILDYFIDRYDLTRSFSESEASVFRQVELLPIKMASSFGNQLENRALSLGQDLLDSGDCSAALTPDETQELLNRFINDTKNVIQTALVNQVGDEEFVFDLVFTSLAAFRPESDNFSRSEARFITALAGAGALSYGLYEASQRGGFDTGGSLDFKLGEDTKLKVGANAKQITLTKLPNQAGGSVGLVLPNGTSLAVGGSSSLFPRPGQTEHRSFNINLGIETTHLRITIHSSGKFVSRVINEGTRREKIMVRTYNKADGQLGVALSTSRELGAGNLTVDLNVLDLNASLLATDMGVENTSVFTSGASLRYSVPLNEQRTTLLILEGNIGMAYDLGTGTATPLYGANVGITVKK